MGSCGRIGYLGLELMDSQVHAIVWPGRAAEGVRETKDCYQLIWVGAIL